MSLIFPSKAVENIKRLDKKITIVLYGLIGVATVLFHAHTTHAGKIMHVDVIFLSAFLIGPLLGVFSGWVSASIYFYLSKTFFILDDDVNKKDVWTTLAYTNIGLIVAGILIVIQYAIYGEPFFSKMDIGRYVKTSTSYFYAIELIKVCLLTWAFLFTVWVLARVVKITVIQSLTVNFVSMLLVYGFGRILIYIVVLILTRTY